MEGYFCASIGRLSYSFTFHVHSSHFQHGFIQCQFTSLQLNVIVILQLKQPISPSRYLSLPPKLLLGCSVERGIPLLSLCFTQQKNPTTLYFCAYKTGFPFFESPWQPLPVPAAGQIHLIWMLVTRSTHSIASRHLPQEKAACHSSLLPFLDSPCLINP